MIVQDILSVCKHCLYRFCKFIAWRHWRATQQDDVVAHAAYGLASQSVDLRARRSRLRLPNAVKAREDRQCA